MTEVSELGLLILHVVAKRGIVARIAEEGTAAVLDEYGVTDNKRRKLFAECVNYAPLAEVIAAVIPAYDAGVAADEITPVEPWEEIIG